MAALIPPMSYASKQAHDQLRVSAAESAPRSEQARAAIAVSNDWRQHPVTRGLINWLTEERDQRIASAQSSANLATPTRSAELLIEARIFSALLDKIKNP